MARRNPVEFADYLSRRKRVAVALAAGWFVLIQPFTHPAFTGPGSARALGWVLTVVVLLLLLLPVAGFVWGRQVRELINDELSRQHARSASIAGFWVAMATALGLFVLPISLEIPAREAIYLVVTAATGAALLRFAWLEWGAYRHG